MSEKEIENMTCAQLFDQGWLWQEELEKNCDTKDQSCYNKWKKAVAYLERCDSLLDELHLFSDNESLDEVTSNELR